MLEGLLDSFGHPVNWDELEKTYSPDRWQIPLEIAPGGGSWPLPFLLALGHGEKVTDSIRVSSLLESPLRAHLKLEKPYWMEPHEMLYMVDGTAVHWWLAQAINQGAEERIEVSFQYSSGQDAVWVSGKPDHYDEKAQALSDYKRMKTYGLKKILENGLEKEKPEYIWQLRFYAELLKATGKPVKPPYKLLVWASDWRAPRRGEAPDPRFGAFEVHPGLNDKAELQDRLGALVSLNGKKLDITDACEDRHAFGSVNGKPRRCLQYCNVNRYCPWWQEVSKL